MPPRVCIKTIGCRSNQADSLEIRRSLLRLGVEFCDGFDGADVIIINTCAVTSRAERDARLQLGRARRQAPGAAIAVTGCMIEVNPPGSWKKYGAAAIFPNAGKHDIAAWIGDLATVRSGTEKAGGGASLLAGSVRPPLKVQDGCSMGCSYCIVPRTRGRERSAAPDEVLEKVRCYEGAGAPEIVLTGVQLGSWGRDLSPPLEIADLIGELLERGTSAALRLGSIEPWGVGRRLVRLFSQSRSRLRPHIHIPLQSGCDAVLERMRRPYTTAGYEKIVESLLAASPELAIGTDVIAGFPGETREEFEQTFHFLRRMPFSYLHVFSFSPRRGTAAARMKEPIPAREIKRRVGELRKLDEHKRKEFMSRFIGKTVEAVLEKTTPKDDIAGTSSHFFKVLVPARQAGARPAGKNVHLEIISLDSGRALARRARSESK